MGPIRQSPHAIAGRLQIAQQPLHAGQHAWQRVVVMRDVITEDPGDAFSLLGHHIGPYRIEVLPGVHTVLVSEEAAGVVVGADAVDGRVVESAFKACPCPPIQQHSAEIENDVGDGRNCNGHRETLLVACVCLPPVYRTHVREGRFRLRVRRFLKVIGAERLAWVLKKANLDVFGDCDDCHADHFEHTINPKLNQHVV